MTYFEKLSDCISVEKSSSEEPRCYRCGKECSGETMIKVDGGNHPMCDTWPCTEGG